jgi:hypothetical protein
MLDPILRSMVKTTFDHRTESRRDGKSSFGLAPEVGGKQKPLLPSAGKPADLPKPLFA